MPPENVSVIVPAYRAEATIARTLASIAAQTVKPREIIVVDDGSDDGTLAAIEACRGQMGDIELKVVAQENLGAGAARNRALKEATSDIVAFLDSDDEWMPDKLARSLAVMVETGADLVSHDYLMISGGDEVLIDCARHFQGVGDPFAAMFLRGNIATSTVLARRSLIVGAGGFDTDLPSAQDYDLWLRLTGDGGASFHIFPGALTRYHVTPGSITSRAGERLRCNRTILLRHAGAVKGLAATALGRAAIIHMQAASAHFAAERPLAAIGSLALAPFTMLGVVGGLYAQPLLWSWVLGMAGLYAFQFRGYIDPILKVTGLK